MTARPFAGLRVLLVAAFNRRYHRSGWALAAALAALGCEVRRCEERRRGWNSILGRALVPRLAAQLRREAAGAVIVFKGTALPPDAGDAFVPALGGATVGLNIHQQFGEGGDPARYGTGANMRVFEPAAVGTPQLSDAKADIARHFTPDREIVLYRSLAELRSHARELLANAPLRHALAAAAQERAVRQHTWRHRLEELLTLVLR